MPVLDKTIKYMFNSREKNKWLNRGYIIYFITNYRLFIYINQRELFEIHPKSSVQIECVCNLCQKHFYATIIHVHNANTLNYTLCKHCRHKYRYENNDLEKEKRIRTNLQKYGYKNVSQVPAIKKKRLQTIKIKYGEQYTSTTQIPEVRAKQIKSLCKHHKIATSLPQMQIHQLIGGSLNFPIEIYPVDIAFPEEKIIIEYNGGGHDLAVKHNSITQEQFNQREIKRKDFLLNRQWNIITLITPHDKLFKLYTNFEIIELINIAKKFCTFTETNKIQYDIINNLSLYKKQINNINTKMQSLWIDIYIEENRIEYINGKTTIDLALSTKRI